MTLAEQIALWADTLPSYAAMIPALYRVWRGEARAHFDA